MHPHLKSVFEKTVELFKADPRVTAAFIAGSAGSSHEDELSDVDPIFVILPEEMDSFERDLPGVFAGLCDRIVLWWPERFNTPTCKNFAILFYVGQHLLQYDINFHIPPQQGRIAVEPYQFLFDKAGILEVKDSVPPPPSSGERMLWLINAYWIWVYIHAKYLRRRDMVKLVYVQQQLFDVHLELAGALHPSVRGQNWWPLALKSIADAPLRNTLMSYLLQESPEAIMAKLDGQMNAFAAMAQEICKQFGLTCPESSQTHIRRHLDKQTACLYR